MGSFEAETVFELYRRRLIPDETVLLKDKVHFYDGNVLVTSWDSIKPRTDFCSGRSVYYFEEGWKVSEFYGKDHEPVYYYCDIIERIARNGRNCLIVLDLLADVKISKNGYVEVLDLGEVAEAMDLGLIDAETAKSALRKLDGLLEKIYGGGLSELLKPLKIIG